MPHLDPDELSLLALYDDWVDDAGREHLRVCPACAADYAALRRTVNAVKSPPDPSGLSTPGPNVWAGIHRELGLSASLERDPLAAAAPDAGTAQRGKGPAAVRRLPVDRPSSAHRAEAPPVKGRGRAGRSARWWQRTGTWMAAAAAAVLVAFGALWVVNREPRELAGADLAPVAQHSATGSAKVVQQPDGSRRLEVRLDKDEARGYQEVWLIAPDLSRLVSVGVMNAETGTFDVPAGLDLAEYPIVDVSDEPVDGNPAHSSDSIVRGTLSS